MPTKHIDTETWNAIEETLVKAVSLAQKPIKESDLLRLLIRVGIDRVRNDELKNLYENNFRCGAIFVSSNGIKHYFEPAVNDCLVELESDDLFLLVIYGKKNSGKSTLINKITKKIKNIQVVDANITRDIKFDSFSLKDKTVLSMIANDKEEAVSLLLTLLITSKENIIISGKS